MQTMSLHNKIAGVHLSQKFASNTESDFRILRHIKNFPGFIGYFIKNRFICYKNSRGSINYAKSDHKFREGKSK